MALIFLLLGAGVGAFFLATPSAGLSFPLDDAWIHMVYARNLGSGHFFSYMPPAPEAGSTSPLWTLVLAGVHLLFPGVLAAKLAGLAALILAAWWARRLAGIVAGLLILLDPLLHFTALSGMEVTLFLFLTLLALERFEAGRLGHAGLAAAGALLTRPEGAFLCLLLACLALKKQSSLKESFQKGLMLILPSLVVTGLWIAFCLMATGRPLPNTFYVKAAFLGGAAWESLPQVMNRFFHDLYQLFMDEGPFYPLAALLLIWPVFRYSLNRKTMALLAFSILLILGVWFTRPILPGSVDIFYWERYFIPGLACIHLVLALGLVKLWQKNRPARFLALGAGVLVAAGFLLNLDVKRDLYERNCRDIARYNVAAGKWVAQHTQPREEVAVLDAGAIAYFGNRRIIDLAGLNRKELIDPSHLYPEADPGDPADLAAHLHGDWLILPKRHYSGHSGFIPVHSIGYDDYSIYDHPETFTLLILRKARQ